MRFEKTDGLAVLRCGLELPLLGRKHPPTLSISIGRTVQVHRFDRATFVHDQFQHAQHVSRNVRMGATADTDGPVPVRERCDRCSYTTAVLLEPESAAALSRRCLPAPGCRRLTRCSRPRKQLQRRRSLLAQPHGWPAVAATGGGRSDRSVCVLRPRRCACRTAIDLRFLRTRRFSASGARRRCQRRKHSAYSHGVTAVRVIEYTATVTTAIRRQAAATNDERSPLPALQLFQQ